MARSQPLDTYTPSFTTTDERSRRSRDPARPVAPTTDASIAPNRTDRSIAPAHRSDRRGSTSDPPRNARILEPVVRRHRGRAQGQGVSWKGVPRKEVKQRSGLVKSWWGKNPQGLREANEKRTDVLGKRSKFGKFCKMM